MSVYLISGQQGVANTRGWKHGYKKWDKAPGRHVEGMADQRRTSLSGDSRRETGRWRMGRQGKTALIAVWNKELISSPKAE